MRLFNLLSDPKEETDIKDANAWVQSVTDRIVNRFIDTTPLLALALGIVSARTLSERGEQAETSHARWDNQALVIVTTAQVSDRTRTRYKKGASRR
jgi:hypothetical protein